MPDKEYNGWKNRSTWNVALWLNNEEGLYRMAVDYVERRILTAWTVPPLTKCSGKWPNDLPNP